MAKSELTIERLRKVLDYDPETGELTWKYRPEAPKQWNTRFAGTVAGTKTKHGYIQVIVDYVFTHAHTIAFALMTGEMPSGLIDHKNRNGYDNRWENLRLADYALNGANAKIHSTNTSGFRGVWFCNTSNKYVSQLCFRGRRRNLGRFSTAEEAADAYKRASKELRGEFSRT